ncbi:universal stress protein [Blastochloris viridis]|uniref:Universal stress protein n=1 Tax=Blastochloris viridis TaxID=1079 RepID=A0A0H5BAP0_BLAVI|nr:universal stress protein [Blastochloris viridis]ALK08573.1 Universal stress protein [Blastochloris viridis]BAR98139.1 universal stress protein family 4 [Blastochloris viridis]CUU41236.1 Universal stress protein [Blastochloris viridis]
MMRILVATDLSERSNRALRRAAMLASERRDDLIAVHVVDDDQPARMVELECREAAAVIEDAFDALDLPDTVTAKILIETGDAFDGVLRAAASQQADLVVMGSHRRRMLADVFVGTTAERVIRHGTRPVLMVNREPEGPYLNVLATTDLSEASVVAFRAARRLGLTDGPHVGLFYAFDPAAKGLVTLSSGSGTATRDYVEDVRSHLRREVHAWIKQNALPVPTSLTLAEGPAPAEIVAEADRGGWELVVVGTHARSVVPRLLHGSVAEYVLRHAARDVLAVPPAALAKAA